MASLFIFSSHIWASFNLYNAGFHSENLVFTALAMYIFYGIIFGHKNKPIYYLCLGIVCGFGTYFSFTFLVTQAAIFLVWFIHDKKLFIKKELYIFLLGFLLGMIPWFYYNFGSGFKGVTDVFPVFFEGKNYFNLQTWLDIIRRFLKIIWFPKMLGFIGLGQFFYYLSGSIYNLIFWFSFIYILWYNRHSWTNIVSAKEFLVFIFPILLLFIATLHGEEPGGSYFMEWKYVVGLFPFIFFTVAILMDRLFFKMRMLKTIAITIFFTLFILVVARYSRKINFQDFGKGFNEPGYSYTFLFESFNSKYPRNFYKILDNITRLSAPEKYEVLTQTLTIHLSENIYPVDFKEYIKLSYRLDEKYRPFFYRILIKGLYYTSDLPLNDLIRQVDILSKAVEDKYKPYLYEGIGALMVKRFPDNTIQYKEGTNLVDKKYVANYYRGLSEPVYIDYIGDYVNRCKSCLTWLDEAYKPLYLENIGEFLAKMGFLMFIIDRIHSDDEEAKIFYDFFKNLDSKQSRYVLEGVGKGLSYFYSPNNKKEIYQFLNHFKEEEKKIIFKKMESY
jgi:hypothetical protein